MLLEARDISKTYGPARALAGVSLSLNPGEVVGYLGPNGAGKTTTMKILTGFLKSDSGSVRYRGKPISDNPILYRKALGYLPENNPLYDEMRVSEYLGWSGKINGMGRGAIESGLARVTRSCELQSALPKKIKELSKGFRQRVGLAQALLHDPDILILDEPTSGLDPNQIAEIRGLIRQLAQSKAILLSTHILSEAETIADRIIILAEGRIVAEGPVATIAKSNQNLATLTLHLYHPNMDTAAVEAAINSIAEVLSVSSSNDAGFSIQFNPESDPRRGILEMAYREGWVIMGMNADQKDIEDVFRQLTKPSITT